jgi:hypothetical protein
MRLFLLLILFSAAPVLAQEVVVSKYRNGGNQQSAIGDTVELTVIRDGLDLRGYSLRDFAVVSATNAFTADPMTSGSGSFRFGSVPLWRSLRAGTVIVLPFSSTELQQQSDTVLTVGLDNSAYFAKSGTFNIAAADMVMLKRPDAAIAGTEGNVHALSAGLTVRDVSGVVPIVRTSDEALNARPFALPDNISGNLSDYNSNRAGTVAQATFGQATNPANQRFLDSLRRLRMPVAVIRYDGPALSRITLAPVPATSDCTVSFQLGAPDTVIITLVDMQGHKQALYQAFHSSGNQTIPLSLAGVAQGAYFLVVSTNHAEWREKVSVVR